MFLFSKMGFPPARPAASSASCCLSTTNPPSFSATLLGEGTRVTPGVLFPSGSNVGLSDGRSGSARIVEVSPRGAGVFPGL